MVPPCSSNKNSLDKEVVHQLMRGKGVLIFLTLILFFQILLIRPSFTLSLTVRTTENSYQQGSNVTIKGTGNVGSNITVVLNSSSNIIIKKIIPVDQYGLFNLTFQLEKNCSTGVYNVKISQESEEVQTFFWITNSSCFFDALSILAENIKLQVNDEISTLEEKGVKIPEVDLVEANSLLNEAIMLHPLDCQRATFNVWESIKIYGKALQIILKEEEGQGEYLGLINAIDRDFNYLNKVNVSAQKIKEAGFNTTIIENLLQVGQENLLLSKSLLDNGYFNESENLRIISKEFITEALEKLNELNQKLQDSKAQTFINETKKKITRVQDKIEKILLNTSISNDTLPEISAVFNESLNMIKNAELLLESSNITYALDKLDEALLHSDFIYSELNNSNKNIINRIYSLDKLESKIFILKERMGNKAFIEEHKEYINIRFILADNIIQKALDITNEDEEFETLYDEAENILEDVDEFIELHIDKSYDNNILDNYTHIHEKLNELNNIIIELMNDIEYNNNNSLIIEEYLNNASISLNVANDYLKNDNIEEAEDYIENAEFYVEKAKGLLDNNMQDEKEETEKDKDEKEETEKDKDEKEETEKDKDEKEEKIIKDKKEKNKTIF
jgi:hypothetical protein